MNNENNQQDDSPYIYDDPKDKKYRRTQIAGFSVIAAAIIATAAGTGALASITPEPIKNFLNMSSSKPKVFESLAVDATAPTDVESSNLIVAGPISVDDNSSTNPPTFKKGKHVIVPPVFVSGDEDSDEDEYEDEDSESEDNDDED